MVPLNIESDLELKQQFATLLLRLNDPFLAAKTIFEPDISRSLYVSQTWPFDPDVIKFKKTLLKQNGKAAYLPTKPEVASELHTIAKQELDTDYRLRAYELFAKIMGYIEKPGAIFNNVSNHNVLIVKDHGTDDEWAKKVLEQQNRLTHAPTSAQ